MDSNRDAPSSSDLPDFSEPSSFPSPDYAALLYMSDDWPQFDVRNEYDAETQIDSHNETEIHFATETQFAETSQLRYFIGLMSADHVEATEAVNQAQTFRTATRAGSLLPPPLAMPERPSTISKMKDNLDFDISEFFDIDAAAAEDSPGESQAACQTVPDGGSSAEGASLLDITRDKFDPAVSFKDYLKLSQMERGASAWKSNLHKGRRGYQVEEAKAKSTSTGPDVDLPKNPFKPGREDCFLPSFSDPTYDEEFAAFAAAGSNLNRQFRKAEPEFELDNVAAAAAAKPSSSRVSSHQNTELSPSSKNDDEFTRAGLIYVAQLLQENPEFSSAPTDANHSYTKEEVQWAENYLPEDVKAWMKQGCRDSGRSGAGSSSKNTEEQRSANPTPYDPNYWAQYDTMMSLEELDSEWDAFEEKNLREKILADNLQKLVVGKDGVPTAAPLSSGSAARVATPENIALLTRNTAGLTQDESLTEDDTNMLTTEKSTLADGGPSIAPIVSRLSEILLDGKGKQAARGVLQEHDGEVPRDDHNNLRKMTFDGVPVAHDNSRPTGIPGHVDFTTEDRNTIRSNQDSISATGENAFQPLHGMAKLAKTPRVPKVPPQSTAEILDPHSSSTLDARQSVNKEVLHPPHSETFSLEASTSSTGSSALHFPDSATLSGTADFECAKCNKVYKKKVYLLKHEAEGNCKPKASGAQRLPVVAGLTMMKLSMTDQELVDNGLPSVEARNYKHLPYCTACNKEFSNTGRLRRHIQQSCPILRDRGVYNQREQSQLATADQGSTLAFPASTTTGSFLMDEEESEVGSSEPSSKPDLSALKTFKASSMVESPALRQSQKHSSLESAASAVMRSAARSQNPTTSYGRGTASMKDTINNTQNHGDDVSKSSPLLPRMRDDAPEVDENRGVYPDRVRLFSDELTLTSPHQSDPLEPFEDLPQSSKNSHAREAGGPSGSMSRPTSSTPATVGNPPSVIFSFTNERLCAIATQRLEELIMTGPSPTIQSLRMWPSFSPKLSASRPVFEFKVTAPGGVNLVSTLRKIFPRMVAKMRVDQIVFMPGDPTSLPSAGEAPAADIVKAQKSNVDKPTMEQPRRSSRTSGGPPDAESQITVKTKTEDGSRNLGEAKRRRSSSRLAELHAEQDKSVAAEKKRQKTNN